MPRQHDARYYYNPETKLYRCPCRACFGKERSRRTFDRHKHNEELRDAAERAGTNPRPFTQLISGAISHQFEGVDAATGMANRVNPLAQYMPGALAHSFAGATADSLLSEASPLAASGPGLGAFAQHVSGSLGLQLTGAAVPIHQTDQSMDFDQDSTYNDPEDYDMEYGHYQAQEGYGQDNEEDNEQFEGSGLDFGQDYYYGHEQDAEQDYEQDYELPEDFVQDYELPDVYEQGHEGGAHTPSAQHEDNLNIQVEADAANNDEPEFLEGNIGGGPGIDEDGEEYIPQDHNPEAPPRLNPTFGMLDIAEQFIDLLEGATLDSDIEPLPAALMQQLTSPRESILQLTEDERWCIDNYFSSDNITEDQYHNLVLAQEKRLPEVAGKLLSYHLVKKLTEELSGVKTIKHDMCVNSCLAFTGPFAKDVGCRLCRESRYHPLSKTHGKKKPRKTFTTILPSMNLQAYYQTEQGVDLRSYGYKRLQENIQERNANNGERKSPFADIHDGEQLAKAMQANMIGENDFLLMLSIDGAQLYRMKDSDCWMYIWIFLDLPPNVRYKKKHILPGAVIPGPNKPKDIDSFLFPSLYHIAALQNSEHGMASWNAKTKEIVWGKPFLALASADGPAMAWMSGCVGHQGKHHCRLYCPIKGRHKPNQGTYYPCRMKPDGYTVEGCSHDDIDLVNLVNAFRQEQSSGAVQVRYESNLARVMSSNSKTLYEKSRLETGICKPCIFSGLNENHMVPVPSCFSGDIMHLPALNIPALLIPLWTGKFDCDPSDSKDKWAWATLTGQTWQKFGQNVENATPYIPVSFDRPPRNPAKKINSGYKAWEFMLLMYGLASCLLRVCLPPVYWMHFCKLVKAIQILLQEEITSAQLITAHLLLTQFSDEFEKLYCQRHPGRIHFCRPCLHALAHLVLEVYRLGPGWLSSQWVMERTIGNLGREIRQHKDTFANLSARAVRRAHVNALQCLIPALNVGSPKEHNALPSGARDMGHGYYLLPAKDRNPVKLPENECIALYLYLQSIGAQVPQLEDFHGIHIVRWARVRLPNGQQVRSKWREEAKLGPVRRARNASVCITSITPQIFKLLLITLYRFN